MEQTKKYGHLAKELMVEGLKELFDRNETIFVVGGEKLPTQEMELLRRNLSQNISRYVVVKNSLCQRLLKGKSYNRLLDFVQGQTALVFGKGDPTLIAKAIVKFAKEHETFKVRGGVVVGEEVDSAKIVTLASLPSRQVLIAKTASGIKAPITGFVFSLSGLLRQLVVALDGVRQKKS